MDVNITRATVLTSRSATKCMQSAMRDRRGESVRKGFLGMKWDLVITENRGKKEQEGGQISKYVTGKERAHRGIARSMDS